MEDREVYEPDEQQTAVVHKPSAEPMALPTEAFNAQTIERAQRRIDIIGQLRLLSIRNTNTNDWVDLGGKPYLTEAGCMKFASIYGISFKDIKVTPANYEDELGPVREFTAEVTAIFQNRQDTEIGMATSAEKFFQRNGKRPPLSEVKTADIMKKAITNAKGRAVRKILGLSFTWDEVRSIMGEAAGNVASVQYKGKSAQRNTTTGKGTVNATKKRLADMIFEIAGGNKEEAAELLFQHSKFTDKDGNERGVRSVQDMSDKWATRTFTKVKKIYEEFMAEGGDPDPEDPIEPPADPF